MIRPGRIDVQEEIGYCTRHQIEEMFKRFYTTDDSIRNSVEFAEKVTSFGRDVSPAQIQGYFMKHKTSTLEEIVNGADKIWEDSRKSDVRDVVKVADKV